MNKKEYSFFDPRNPIYLHFAKWVVVISSVLVIFIGMLGMESDSVVGVSLVISGAFSYFIGMIFVNMLYNIRDIKVQTELTNKILAEQLRHLKDE